MNLKNINVLVDGHNLMLKHGTGIKTYASMLVKALGLLNANVYLLSDAPIPKSRNPILREVMFFDNRTTNKPNAILRIANGVINSRARILDRNHVVIIEKELDTVKGSVIFQDCYWLAHTLKKALGQTLRIIPNKRIDIWHATYPLPINIKGAKKITTIHDVIPLKLPYTTLDDKKIYYRILRESIRQSSIILAPSEHTKKDILNIFECDPSKIVVTYEPVDITQIHESQDVISSALQNRFKLSYKKYILFVGAIEPKKNIGRLIDAYSLTKANMPLVIVGKKAWMWEDEIGKLESIFGKKFYEKVRILEYVSKYELSYLYAGASCLVFPSLYEGFGLPPLEAMTVGCPVITSNVSSLPEVCGDAVLYVDPNDVHDIRSKIEELLGSSQLQEKLSIAGKERAKFFNMDEYLGKLSRAYERVL